MQRKKCLSSISWRTKKLFTLQDLEWFFIAIVACCLPVVKEQHEEAGKRAFSWKTDEAESLSYRVTRSPLKREYSVLMCVLAFCLEITGEPREAAYSIWGAAFDFCVWGLWRKSPVMATKMGNGHLVPDFCVRVRVCVRTGSELEDLREAFILPFLTSGQHTTLQNLSL